MILLPKRTIPCLSALILAFMTTATASYGVTITNGSLSVDIREDNGAIGSLIFRGQDFYDGSRSSGSNWILQVGDDTSTFSANNINTGTNPIGVTAVTPMSGAVTVLGNYTAGGGVNIGIERVYSLVGANRLRTTTTLMNLGGEATISLVDTFDPTPSSFVFIPTPPTRNDLDNGVARVVDEDSSHAIEYSGLRSAFVPNSDFGIFNGTQLNAFFTDPPFDPDNQVASLDVFIGVRELIPADTSLTFSFDQTLLVGEPVPVPEPSTILCSFLLLGGGVFLKRRLHRQGSAVRA
jgi:hypothetical protein